MNLCLVNCSHSQQNARNKGEKNRLLGGMVGTQTSALIQEIFEVVNSSRLKETAKIRSSKISFELIFTSYIKFLQPVETAEIKRAK